MQTADAYGNARELNHGATDPKNSSLEINSLENSYSKEFFVEDFDCVCSEIFFLQFFWTNVRYIALYTVIAARRSETKGIIKNHFFEVNFLLNFPLLEIVYHISLSLELRDNKKYILKWFHRLDQFHRGDTVSGSARDQREAPGADYSFHC